MRLAQWISFPENNRPPVLFAMLDRHDSLADTAQSFGHDAPTRFHGGVHKFGSAQAYSQEIDRFYAKQLTATRH